MNDAPVALVTGASGRLGSRVAEELARRSFRLALAGGRSAPEHPSAASSHRVDLADPDGPARLAEEAWAGAGRIDALVWAAGMVQRPRIDLLDTGADELDRQWALNARAPLLLATAVARRWLAEPARGPRTIVVVTSMAAGVTDPSLGAYCAAKAEASGFVSALALRLAPHGIAVHEVCPGFLSDPGGAPAPTPAGTAGDLPATARLVAALAAGDFPGLTGQRLWAAGGAQIPTLTGR